MEPPQSPASPARFLRIAIADDHFLTGESLFSMISQNGHKCELVGKASTAEEAISLCQRFTPDLLLLDLNMAGQGGVAIVPKIKRIAPATRILLYCTKVNERDVLAALRAGADGFLEETCSRSDFLQAVDRLINGGNYLCPKSVNALARSLRPTVGQGATRNQGNTQLTSREKEIIAFVAAGDSSKEIAKKLFLSVSTIETHRANLMAKVGARNIAQLILYALREGLVDPPVISTF
jgi:DNA-binding NarL/FixJ family response regulator